MTQRTSSFWQRYALKKTPNTQVCAFKGCGSDGIYRAPKHDHPQNIKDNNCWHWFCLMHVREYNAAWNYYKGMTEAEIIALWERDITWDRPSWPLGSWQSAAAVKPFLRATTKPHNGDSSYKDPFGLFEESIHYTQSPSPKKRTITAEDEAIILFNLPPHFKPADLQKAYRNLVKKHHPDVNGGSLEAEAHIKKINIAYQLLKKYNLSQ